MNMKTLSIGFQIVCVLAGNKNTEAAFLAHDVLLYLDVKRWPLFINCFVDSQSDKFICLHI